MATAQEDDLLEANSEQERTTTTEVESDDDTRYVLNNSSRRPISGTFGSTANGEQRQTLGRLYAEHQDDESSTRSSRRHAADRSNNELRSYDIRQYPRSTAAPALEGARGGPYSI